MEKITQHHIEMEFDNSKEIDSKLSNLLLKAKELNAELEKASSLISKLTSQNQSQPLPLVTLTLAPQ